MPRKLIFGPSSYEDGGEIQPTNLKRVKKSAGGRGNQIFCYFLIILNDFTEFRTNQKEVSTLPHSFPGVLTYQKHRRMDKPICWYIGRMAGTVQQ